MIDYQQLKAILPQSYPFLLVDRVEEFVKGERLVAVKNITFDEWPFTNCRFKAKDYPVILLMEAAAQAALVLYYLSKMKKGGGKIEYRLGKIEAKFRDSVMVGEQLRINTFATKMFDKFGYMDTYLYVENRRNIGQIRIGYSVI